MIVPDRGIAHARPLPQPPRDEPDAAPADAGVHDALQRAPEPPAAAREIARHAAPRRDTADLLSRLARPVPQPEPDAGDGGIGTLRDLLGHAQSATQAIERALRQIAREDACPVPEAPTTPEPTPQQQGAADAAQVQQAWDDTLARGGSEAEAAQIASAKLSELTRAHAGDAAYTTALLRAAQPTLDRIGTVLGDHVDGRYNGNAADKAMIVDTVRNLSVAAGHSGELGALIIASKIAPHIPDKGDLRKLDDAFYEHIEAGGSAALFGALYQQLEAEGKHTAAEELKDRHGGLLDWVRDRIDDAIDLAGSVIGGVVGGVASVVRNGVGLAVDIAQGTVDLAGDALEGAQEAVRFAVENGLKLTGRLRDWAIGQYRDALDAAIGVGDHIDELEVGDSYEVGIDAELALALGIEVGAGVKVTRTEDGYEVTGHFNAAVDIQEYAGAQAGGDVSVTFHADSAAQARDFALMFASGPKIGELGALRQNLQSVEIGGSAALEAQLSKIGILGTQTGVEAEAGVRGSYRIDFEDGKPVALVRTATLSAEGSAEGDAALESGSMRVARQLAEGLGIDVPDSYGAHAELEVTAETRIPLDGNEVIIADLLAGDLSGAILAQTADGVTHTVKVSGLIEGAAGSDSHKGVTFELEVSDLDARDVAAVLRALRTGDLDALDEIDVDVSGWWATTERTDDSRLDFNWMIAGNGISIETESGVTDVDWAHRHQI